MVEHWLNGHLGLEEHSTYKPTSHTSTVGLVKNLTTVMIIRQFHICYDDSFTLRALQALRLGNTLDATPNPETSPPEIHHNPRDSRTT